MIRYRFGALACALCIVLAINAQQVGFYSSNIAKIAALLLPHTFDDLRPGVNDMKYQDMPLMVRVNDNHQIEHIGIKLFPDEVRQQHYHPVYDYLEQAYLKHKLKKDSDVAVTFRKGSWADFDKVSESTNVEVTTIRNLKYVVEWSTPQATLLSVEVPMDYDRVLGSDRRELEQIYLRDLQAYKIQDHQPTPIDLSQLQLTYTDTDDVFVCKGRTLHNDNINQDIYFQATPDNSVRLINSPDQQLETLINMLNAPDYVDNGTMVRVKFNLYGNKKEYLTIPLRQLLAYSASLHETAYVGIEREADDCIEVSLFLENLDSGYEHVVFVRCRPESLLSNDIPLEAEAYLYSPSR